MLGTKAQFIKCRYVLENFIEKGYKILILDTGQHKEITSHELNVLHGSYKVVSLSKNTQNVSSIFYMIIWFIKIIFSIKKIKELEEAYYCLVHGDTVSTLLGMIVGKKNNLKIVHIESGFTSGNLLKPFPEELMRNIVTRFSDVLCIDTQINEKNILKYENKKEIIRISRNTIFDSVIKNINFSNINNELTVTVHRTENIYNKKLFDNFIKLLCVINSLSMFERIVWYTHDITNKTLKKRGYIDLLKKNNIHLKKLIPYKEFINILYSSKAVITDGGSIAEECSILGITTVLWRDVEEKMEILNNNVFLSRYKNDEIIKFLQNKSKRLSDLNNYESPSFELVKKIINL